MKRPLVLMGALFFVITPTAFCQGVPLSPSVEKLGHKPEAKTLMNAALKKAKEQKKNVLVVFDASW